MADRTSRRAVMLGADLVRVASQGATPLGVDLRPRPPSSRASASRRASPSGNPLQRHIPDESLSRVSSYDWFGSFAFYPLGLAIWGPLASAIGLGASLWLAFALFIAAIAAVLCVADVRRPNELLSPRP